MCRSTPWDSIIDLGAWAGRLRTLCVGPFGTERASADALQQALPRGTRRYLLSRTQNRLHAKPMQHTRRGREHEPPGQGNTEGVCLALFS